MIEFFEIGEIVKVHGCRGGVKARSYLTAPESLLPRLEAVYLDGPGRERERFPIRRRRWGNAGLFLELAGVDDPSAAQALVGCRVLVPADKLAPLSEGEYYWRELIGMEARTEEGVSLGRIAEIFPTGGHDVYVCRTAGEERLLPAVEEVIRKVDRTGRIVTVRLPAGL
ncbi:MAG: ribosome maturation factor RimM [Pseudomonadota bacterium]|nr:ribosome maturation factor RimM [Pseudomonadota bacterium]